MASLQKRHRRSQPFAVETAGATEIEAAPVVLGGSGGAASSIPFGFIPALDYVPSFHVSKRRCGDENWNEKLLTNPERVLPRGK